MKIFVRLQLLTYELGNESLELIKIPAIFGGNSDSSISVRVWTGGLLHKIGAKQIDDVVAKMSQSSFCRAIVHYKSLKNEIRSFRGYFAPSPLSQIWNSPVGYRSVGRLEERERKSFESLERLVSSRALERYPSLLEARILFLGSVGAVADSLAEAIRKSTLSDRVFGSADVVEADDIFSEISVLDDLCSSPDQLSRMDEKFDRLHDVLIGKLDLCQSLVRGEGNRRAQLRAAIGKVDERGTGIVTFENPRDVSVQLNCQLQPYLVPRNSLAGL